jgi:carboxynorspermidine decarboxylase
MVSFDPNAVQTPCYVNDLGVLRHNLELLAKVQEQSACSVLLALKGYAMWSTFALVGRYLRGAAASSLDEARLAREYLGGELHVYSPAYSEADLRSLLEMADHIVFNSIGQWRRFRPTVEASPRACHRGLRVNPEHSEVTVPLYDPCAPHSRLGVLSSELESEGLDGIDGLHFHTLCEKNVDALERTVMAFERRFAAQLRHVDWVNFGGGHHITRSDYGVDRLVALVRDFQERHGVRVYLEPGEAVALGAGVLVASVLDVVDRPLPVAILDTSAAAHMPDVLEMPYRPRVCGAGEPGEHPFCYRLGGVTCLAGDVIGDYSFREPLRVGDRVVFEDMAHYTMVKNSTFNGVRLPSIATFEPRTGELRLVRQFGYEDYRCRLS